MINFAWEFENNGKIRSWIRIKLLYKRRLTTDRACSFIMMPWRGVPGLWLVGLLYDDGDGSVYVVFGIDAYAGGAAETESYQGSPAEPGEAGAYAEAVLSLPDATEDR